MTNTAPRTRTDGSIDTAFYMARGRHLRSQQAHRITKAGATRLPALAIIAVTILAAILILPIAA